MSRLMDEFLAEAAKEAAKKIGMECAAKMLKDDLPIEKIAKWSGLSLDEVIALQAELNKT